MNIFNMLCLFFVLQEHKPITSEFVFLLCLLCSVRSTLLVPLVQIPCTDCFSVSTVTASAVCV